MNVEIEQSQATIEIGGKIVEDVVRQIYKGDTEPTDSEILIWIDTSGTTPTTDTYLTTSDNKEFITANNEKFILKEA